MMILDMVAHHAGKFSRWKTFESRMIRTKGAWCVIRWPGSGSPRDDYDDVDPVQHSGFRSLTFFTIKNARTRGKSDDSLRRGIGSGNDNAPRGDPVFWSAGSKVGPESRGWKGARDRYIRDTAVARLTWRCGPSPRRRWPLPRGFGQSAVSQNTPSVAIVDVRRCSAALGRSPSSFHSRVPRGRRRTVRDYFSDGLCAFTRHTATYLYSCEKKLRAAGQALR